MRTFWENERPSSSEEEPETENLLYQEIESEARNCSSVGSIEIVKDLDLSKMSSNLKFDSLNIK